MDPAEIAKLEKDLSGLSADEIERRMAHGNIWRGDAKRIVESHLEKRQIVRRERFTAKDRNIQIWILRVPILGVLVRIASIAATILVK